MKLIYRIALRLSLVLLPLIALWATLFYFAMVDEINDETDDTLGNYSELIITRMLAGRELPPLNSGSNNSYSITPVDDLYAEQHPHMDYYDADVFIPEKDDTEPARILTTIFQDSEGHYYELKVATPTFEKDDLIESILSWMIFLYIILLVTVIGITIFVFHRNMRPLYALLRWLDNYTPGRHDLPIAAKTNITEFKKLNIAAQRAAERSEELFERQKQFIGNASHELQTPLAVISSRLEWLLDNTETDEIQTGELLKIQRSVGHIVRLNKTLLLLTKIENGQFPECSDVDISSIAEELHTLYEEIYSSHNISCHFECQEKLIVHMNESLASTLVSNLLKNAYIHTPSDKEIWVSIDMHTLTVANYGESPLDAEHIFDRFYQGSKKEGSTGLGLALVNAVGHYYGLEIEYRFENKSHIFSVTWPASRH